LDSRFFFFLGTSLLNPQVAQNEFGALAPAGFSVMVSRKFGLFPQPVLTGCRASVRACTPL
jgi:hypothetical protein